MKSYSVEDFQRAILIIKAIKGELALGTKHYRDGVLITSIKEILKALMDNKLIIEPTTERQHLFGGYTK